MIRIIILAIILAVNIGCAAFTTRVYIPEKTHVEQIQWMTQGDCVTKARKGQILYNRSGIISRLACGYVGVSGNHCAHCWNEVYCPDDGLWHLIDLHDRMGYDGWPRDQYCEYVTSVYWYGIPSVAEIQLEQNADWYAPESDMELISKLPRGK